MVPFPTHGSGDLKVDDVSNAFNDLEDTALKLIHLKPQLDETIIVPDETVWDTEWLDCWGSFTLPTESGLRGAPYDGPSVTVLS